MYLVICKYVEKSRLSKNHEKSEGLATIIRRERMIIFFYNYKEGEDDEQEDREDGDEDHDEDQGGLGAGLDAWGIGMR